MRKLSIMCSILFVLGFTSAPTFAMEYCTDYLEAGNPGGWTASLKTFDEEITMDVGSTIFVDVWINDLPVQDKLMTGGFVATWSDNLAVSATPYNFINGGPWDPSVGILIAVTNIVEVGLGNLDCPNVDAGGDIILAKLEVQKVGEGTATITFTTPPFETFVSCILYRYDPIILKHIFTINGGECDPPDCDDQNPCTDDSCVDGECIHEPIPGCEECVTLTIGSTNGAPGETGVPVGVGLINQNDKSMGVQVDVCDEGDYLTCTGCEAEYTRAEFFSCSTNELEDGCCRVILVSDSGLLIDEGTGNILTIRYDVSEDAPGGCKDLTLVNAKVSDVVEDPLPICELESGEFCFALCGDINPSIDPTNCGNFVVDILDVLDAIDITLGVIAVPTECQWNKGNVPNGLPLPEGMGCREPNGEIDIFDILVIIDVVLERPNCCVL